MSGATIEVDIGGPTRLSIRGAVQGRRWLLSLTNWVLADGLDFSTLTGATAELRRSPGSGRAQYVMPVDITQKASMALFVDTDHGDGLDTSKVKLGLYSWALQFQADDPRLDLYVPLHGYWPVVDRLPE